VAVSIDQEAQELAARIGRRVVEIRTAKGWSQKDFATAMNTSVQWISQVETGRNLTVHSLVRLARILGVRVPDLFRAPRKTTTAKGPGRPRKSR